MEKLASIQQLLLRSRRLPWLIIALTLLILGGTIFLARQQLRDKVRDQLVGRDAEVLHAVAQMYLNEVDNPVPDSDQQILVLLKTSRLSGVMGARLFDANGRFIEAFDFDVLEANLNPADLPLLKKELRPVSRFHSAIRFSKNFLPRDRSGADPVAPMLEVNIPLHIRKSDQLLGIAQFLIEGESIAAEFARLGRNLTRQSVAAFAVSGMVLIITLGWAFRRLHRAHGLLAARTDQLLQANQELSLAARTSALGAVSAHLIHGLKNPLSGLQNFVANRSASSHQVEGEWEEAVASTRRMQSMINEVVNVLREEESGVRYEVTLAELTDVVTSRIQPLARETGVTFSVQCDAEAVLSNRVANLVALILVNLVQNSLQSTPAGKSVRLHFAETEDHLVCEVRDEGTGLPEELKQNLFAPCRSSRKGGSGIGLSISKQLANHLGAGLELKNSTSRGCVFALTLPLVLCVGRRPMEVAAQR